MTDEEWTSKTLALIVAAEARRRGRYIDSLGFPSVGIGFNLLRADAIDVLAELGADWRSIMDGTGELTDVQIDKLFARCWAETLRFVRLLFPNWEQLRPEARSVLADMAYQMRGRLAGFSRMRDAVARLDYREMVNEMRLSRWARQCPDRVSRDAALIEAAIGVLELELVEVEVDAPIDRPTPKDRSVR